MAKLFDIDRNKIVPNPDVLAIPAMKKIWNRDKSKTKDKAMREIAYVVFLCDFHSPYKDLRISEKEKIIIEDTFKADKWEPDDIIKDAIEVYKKLQVTPSMRLLTASRNSVEKLSDYFDQINFKEIDNFGKPIYSAIELTRNLKEVGNVVKSLTNLDKQVKLELEEQSVRGGNKIGYFENPSDEESE